MPPFWTPADAILTFAGCGLVALVLVMLVGVAMDVQAFLSNRLHDWWTK
jgi:uncharacterized membrane protein YczE